MKMACTKFGSKNVRMEKLGRMTTPESLMKKLLSKRSTSLSSGQYKWKCVDCGEQGIIMREPLKTTLSNLS
jgi:hypothetical protein